MSRPDYSALLEEDACLVILKELIEQINGSLSDSILVVVCRNFGHDKSREWIRSRMRHLNEVGAVRLVEAGSVLVATITDRGEDHVRNRIILDGVKRPSRG